MYIMNCPFTLLLAAVLFFLLTPGVLVRLPPKCTLLTCAAFHAVVFTIAFYFGCKLIKSLRTREGMKEEEEEKEKDE
jgi:uncharacterized membrane protein